MGKRAKKPDSKDLDLVVSAVEDHILRTHKICGIAEIIKETSFPRHKCEEILDALVSSGRLAIVYKRKGTPDLYMPTYMFEEVLTKQTKPKWLDKYSFKEKSKKIKEIEKAQEEINHYEMIERLLYGTGRSLEKSVEYCLVFLEFEDVQHHEKEDTQDISFSHDGKKFLLEVEGTTKKGSKPKVNQLQGWVEEEVEKGTDPDKVRGIFVVNHFRDEDPEGREGPLTPHAVRFLKLYKFRFFTTFFLFKKVKEVNQGSLTKEEARKILVEGEKY